MAQTLGFKLKEIDPKCLNSLMTRPAGWHEQTTGLDVFVLLCKGNNYVEQRYSLTAVINEEQRLLQIDCRPDFPAPAASWWYI